MELSREPDEKAQPNRMLVTFQHPVAALIDRRILLISSAVCEEIFQAVTRIAPKKMLAEAPELENIHPAAVASKLEDYPLLLRIVCLGDGIELLNQPELIVKWNNIAAICNLSTEQWTALRKPPRKSNRKK